MLAAYPPGARYRRHFDSYGGHDIPRFITCLLYLAWEPREGGELRAYAPRANANADGISSASNGDDDPGPYRDIQPVPGRLCCFFSQEVEHDVLPSKGERCALTLWIWSNRKDDQGR